MEPKQVNALLDKVILLGVLLVVVLVLGKLLSWLITPSWGR